MLAAKLAVCMKDGELQLLILRGMYDRRKTKRDFGAYDFKELVPDAGEFGRICIQLRDKGLVEWISPAGEHLLAIGVARIKAKGIDLIEHEEEETKPPEFHEPTETTQARCPKCQDERKVFVLKTETKTTEWCYDEQSPPACFYDKYSILKCAGCGFVFLQKEKWNTEDTDEFLRPNCLTETFPQWAEEPVPEWVTEQLRSRTSGLIFEKLREVLLAFESGWHWLACVGCRSVLEAAMIEKIGDQGNFNDNLDAYNEAGHISSGDKDQLKAVIEVGHGATHRSFQPTRDQVKTAIDIVCRVLQGIYVHGPQAQSLKASVPPRQRR